MPGMVFHAVKDPEVRLQVNLVRHEGALAYLLEGDFTKVVPGMELSALRRKN